MTERITSGQNSKIKALLALQEKSRERRKQGLFIVEGRREFGLCLAAGFVPDSIFYCPEIFGAGGDRAPSEVGLRPTPPPASPAVPPLPGRGRHVLQGLYPLQEETKIFEVSREVYEKIAYRDGTEGIIAEMKVRTLGLEDLHLGAQPLVVVLESVEKPGNLGAILRSADAAGADAVIVCDPLTDLFNPNLIRASLGALFTTQTVTATSEETIKWLKSNRVQIFTAQLQDSDLYYEADFRGPTALVMGTESTGLTECWRQAADRRIRIPMQGRLDSLNVSVSAAILLYEALRQRS
ncbi:MAG: RNA methyltransferase [Bacteroidales bacterium]|jgi:TrmH family RNA methyltransferase|nr:RNA methyltransferase [Bacteroidota bacterium]NLN98689.1 RNA methyltransferase [Bacteroidales bacterium]